MDQPRRREERSIKQGDKIRVKNAFGEIELLAKVTPRVVPGTVCISQGAWHDADMYGDRVDKGGCINTLTTHRPSPLAKGNPQHSNICRLPRRRATSAERVIYHVSTAFYFDGTRCTGCKTCQMACKDYKNIDWASRSATCTR